MSWLVYVLECGDATLYTGVTNDLERRLDLHERGRGARYTRGRAPFVVRYVEAAANKRVAFLSLRKVKEGKEVQPSGPVPDSQWGLKPSLEPADLNLVNFGADSVTIGDRRFNAQKCKIEIKPEKRAPISLTEWTDAKGVILAVEDNAEPDIRMGLLQFKRYSTITPPSAPATQK